MVGTQYGTNFAGSRIRTLFIDGRSINSLNMRNSQDPFLNRSIGCQNDIVLVLPEGVLPFFGKHAYYLKRDLVEADYFTNRIFAAGKQVINDGLSNQGHFRSAVHIRIGERYTRLQFPLPDG